MSKTKLLNIQIHLRDQPLVLSFKEVSKLTKFLIKSDQEKLKTPVIVGNTFLIYFEILRLILKQRW